LAHVTYVGHATVLIDTGSIRILTDPFLRDRLAFLRRHGANPAPALLEDRAPDIVLISHLHYDHADLPSLRRLPATTTVIAPKGSGKYLARSAGVSVHEMVEGDSVSLPGVEITAMPADHGSAISISRPMSRCLGYVLRNHFSIYFAGDTGLFEGMAEIGRDFDLALALLPVWGYSPHVGDGHLTPLTAAQALQHLRPRIAVPIHWGSLRPVGPYALWKKANYLSRPPRSFAQHAAHMAPATEVRVLQPGQSTVVQ
jgi:L-ascorbate metabolism protein UlaG (beta-lactamase superfamily)